MRIIASLALATAIWLPSLHWFFTPDPDAVLRALTARQLAAWKDGPPPELAQLRRANPEWDLMARTFTVLGLAKLGPQNLATIDRIIDDTLALEAAHGHHYFLLPYSHRAPFVDRAGRSLFVDGELAMMLAVRERLAPGRASELHERIARVAAHIERGPVLVGESYPDEVWLFCNAVAIAAIRTAEPEHPLPARWLASLKAHFVDAKTGLVVAKTTLDGRVQDGPEGSTVWLVADMLRYIDEDFARDQYARAKRELAGGLWGFAWAREWPDSWPGVDDVDSGPTIPLVGANAGASGLAIVGAASFGDGAYLRGLLTSLDFAGFPRASGGYAAGNLLSDAVIFYALTRSS
jgi:hypothetical protein